MTNQELQEWVDTVLTQGVEVNLLFPNSYNHLHKGYGYQINLKKDRQTYCVMVRRDISEPRFFIHSIWKVCLDKNHNEKISVMELEGRELLLDPKEPRRFGPDVSHIAITGTLHL